MIEDKDINQTIVIKGLRLACDVCNNCKWFVYHDYDLDYYICTRCGLVTNQKDTRLSVREE